MKREKKGRVNTYVCTNDQYILQLDFTTCERHLCSVPTVGDIYEK